MKPALFLLAPLLSTAAFAQSAADDIGPIVDATKDCFAVTAGSISGQDILTARGWTKSKTIKSSGYWHYTKSDTGLNVGLFKSARLPRACVVFTKPLTVPSVGELTRRVREISEPAEFSSLPLLIFLDSSIRKVKLNLSPKTADTLSVAISVNPAGTS